MPTEKMRLRNGSLRTVLATVLLLVLLMTTTGKALALDLGAVIGGTNIATTLEVPGSYLSPQLNKVSSSTNNADSPQDFNVADLVSIGYVSTDGSVQYHIGFIRDETLGQTYSVVRHEADSRIVRRWIPPYSPMVYIIPWDIVISQSNFPVAVIGTIPLDHRLPEPNMLARRFDGADDRIFAYDAELQQWRHIPDWATFQAMGFYWCNVTAADAGFFERITIGPQFPASGTPERDDHPNCQA